MGEIVTFERNGSKRLQRKIIQRGNPAISKFNFERFIADVDSIPTSLRDTINGSKRIDLTMVHINKKNVKV